jgi:hypothetical protein
MKILLGELIEVDQTLVGHASGHSLVRQVDWLCSASAYVSAR